MAMRDTVIFVAILLLSMTASAQSLEWHVWTDKRTYRLGQPVRLSSEVCNTGTSTIAVDINTVQGVLDSNGDGVTCYSTVPWLIVVDIPPGECRATVYSEIVWDQLDCFNDFEQVAPGWYRGTIYDSFHLSEPFEIQGSSGIPISPWARGFFVLTLGAAGFAALRRH